LNFVVCVKQTPDTAELPKISAAEAVSGDIKATLVLNPWDEFAVEEGLLLQDRFGGDVTVITMGPEKASDALKDAIARGIQSAVLLNDPAFAGSDAWGTAATLAGAIKKNGAFDVVLTGKMSVDGNSGLVAPGLARKLGATLLTNVVKIVDVSGGKITVERMLEEGRETISASASGCRFRQQGDQRASLSQLHGHPQGRQGMPSRYLGAGRSGPRRRRMWALRPQPRLNWTDVRKPPARSSQVVMVKEATAGSDGCQAG
jgi:electron transfer flavoprotein beta subunit